MKVTEKMYVYCWQKTLNT